MTNYWWSLLTSHICSKFEPDLSHHSHLTNWGSMNNRGGVTLHPTHEKNFYWKLIWENDILMRKKMSWNPNWFFFSFLSDWWIHIQIHPHPTLELCSNWMVSKQVDLAPILIGHHCLIKMMASAQSSICSQDYFS